MTGRIKSWLMNAMLILVAIGFTLGLTEIGLRLLYPQPTGLSHQDPYGLAMHWPGITRSLPRYGTRVSFNSVGMRDTEHTLLKPTGVFRVLLLGDSFMEALQVPFEESFPFLLQQDLARQTGKLVEVVNAGVSGWGTDDELRYLTRYGLQYHPDLVVVAMTIHNDISDNFRQDWHTVQDGVLVEQPKVPASYLGYKVTELKAFLATHFQTYQLWRKVRHRSEIRLIGAQLNSHIVQLFQEPPSERIRSGFEFTALLLQRIQEVTAAAGGETALVLLPLRVQVTDSSFAAFVSAAGADTTTMPLTAPQRRLLSTASGLRMPVVDLLPVFRDWTAAGGADPYLEWDGHWNATGHRVAASVTARALVADGLIK